jgi:hypothetical protein
VVKWSGRAVDHGGGAAVVVAAVGVGVVAGN